MTRPPRDPDGTASPIARRSARQLRRQATEAEKELWWHLRRKLAVDGTHFRRQVPIGSYVADFCCHAHRLVIELDGSQHAQAPQAGRDAARDAWLAARGYRVLRFWNAEVFREIDGIVQTIDAALRERSDHSPAEAVLVGGG